MKRKIVLLCVGAVLLLVLTAGFVWWQLPVVFLEDVAPAAVTRIEIFNGTNGQCFSVEDRSDIELIVRRIQSVKVYREEWEERDGFVYSLSFYTADGERIAHFEINDSDTLREGNMEYEAEYDEDDYGMLGISDEHYDALGFYYIEALEREQQNTPTQ